jgi:hypothetical protein
VSDEITAAAALIGAGIGFGGGLVKDYLQGRREDQNRFADARKETYARFSALSSKCWDVLIKMPRASQTIDSVEAAELPVLPELRELGMLADEIRLIGTPPVFHAVRQLRNFYDFWWLDRIGLRSDDPGVPWPNPMEAITFRADFLREARRELRIPDEDDRRWRFLRKHQGGDR